jgi:anti-sigma factor (TIGR02949 family)
MSGMSCQDVRVRLLEFQRGRIDPPARAQIEAHLESCAACAHEAAAEHALSEALEERLPQHAAPLALKRRLAAQWPATVPRPSWWSRWGRPVLPAVAVAAVLLVVLPIYYRHATVLPGTGAGMVAEAVTDHLRVISSQHPLDIEGGGMHQVKPWFEGRLDFAPVVPFLGDEEFPLRGGALGYFMDRKAAVFVFRRRLHAISLIVFRAEGLPWPVRGREPMGSTETYPSVARGFNVILWRRGELGYALVSDLDRQELTQLVMRLVRDA